MPDLPLTLKDISDLMTLLAQTDSDIVPLKVGTLQHYVNPNDAARRKPYLQTILLGNQRIAYLPDVLRWIEEYKVAPKLGRRGTGEKQPKNKKTVRASKAKKLRGKRK